jgi:hypothetical protein
VLGFFAFLLFVFGTADGGVLGALFNAEINDTPDSGFVDSFDNIDTIANAQHGITITYSSLFISSVVFVVSYAIVLFVSMNRSGISDKATKVAMFAVVPLYIAYIVVRIAFTIQYQTADLVDDLNLADITNFTWALFTNLFYSAIAITLIAMGMSRTMWVEGAQPPVTMPIVMTQGWPQQGWTQQYYYAAPNMPQQQTYYYPTSWPQQPQPQPQQQQPEQTHEQQQQTQESQSPPQSSPSQPPYPELIREIP